MAKGGSRKGTPYEREIAKELSLWWSGGETDEIFWRPSGSGGRATNRVKRGVATERGHGDLDFIDPRGKPFIDFFYCELKRGFSTTSKGWVLSLLDLIDGGPEKYRTLERWWEKAERRSAAAGGKEILIIFRRDHRSSCAVISNDLLLTWNDEKDPYTGYWISVNTDALSVAILPLEQFKAWVKPSFFI